MIKKMKSGYLLTTDLLFTNNYKVFSASEAACDSTEPVVLFDGEGSKKKKSVGYF